MASVASKLDEDDLGDMDIGFGGDIKEVTRGSKKLFIYTFVEGVEVRAICDGEKRGSFEEEPGVYYATASEMVSLVKEKAEGLATSNSTNRDRFKTEILLANVTSVAKMSLGRIMRDWTRQHPPKRKVRTTRLIGAEARRELRRQRKRRRRTMFQLTDNVPFAHMGPLSPREQAIVEHFTARGGQDPQPNQLQGRAEDEVTDTNSDEESEEEADKEGSEDEIEKRREEEGAEADGEEIEPPGDQEAESSESDNDGEGEDSEPPQQRDGETEDEGGNAGEGAADGENPGGNENQQAPPTQQRQQQRQRGRAVQRRNIQDEEPTIAYREEVVMEPVLMTFEALAKEFVACFKHLEELSVKFHDDRVRQFPPFSYQHNPLARLFSIRAALMDLESAHVGVLGSAQAGAQHTRNYFPASYVLSLYLKGFPDRFRDQVNSAVTVDPARYMHGWDDVLDRIEEMLGIWGKTSDVVYLGLLSQIKQGARGGASKGTSSDSSGRSGKKPRGNNSSSHDWGRFINSLKEEESAAQDDHGDEEDDAPVTKSELKSIIAAALAANPKSLLQQTRDHDKGYKRRDDHQGDSRGRRHQREHGYGGRGFDNGRRSPGGRAMTFHDKLRIASNWQSKMCKEGTPKDLKLCIGCHEWHFLHVPYGCPKEMVRDRDPKSQPFNDFPATKEAQSILRVQDEEDLRTFKQKHEGKTPREYRSSASRDQRYQNRRKDF
jgi:hypothetical protein